MANFTSDHTGNEIDLSIASGSTTTGVIRDFNTLSGSLISTINVGGEINTLSHITASGNISASGTVFASKFESAGASGETIAFNDNLNITGNITASGDISSSGNIKGNLLLANNHTVGGFADSAIQLGFENNTPISIGKLANPVLFVGHITASGNISASGTITALQYGGNISGSSTSTGSFGRTSTTTLDLDSIQGNWTNAGNTVADLGTITTIDINGGTINGITDLAVADGGTGASTLTDGGVLLGSGTGAITAMAVLTDGQMIVGDGTTDPVAESGATLRTSIGVGTTDNVQFAQITGSVVSASSGIFTSVDIDGGSITGITDLAVADGGTGASTFTDGGILLGNGTGAIQATAVLTDGQMIVGDGTTDPAIESGATLRTSIGVGTGDNVTFTNITGTGNTALGNAAADTHTFVGHITASAYKISASAFIGDGSGLTGVAQDIDTLDAFSGVPHATQDEFLISDNGTEKRATMTMVANGAFALVSGEATVAAGGALTIAANVIGNNELKQNDDITLQSLTSAGTGSFGYATAVEISASSIILPNNSISGDVVEGGTIAATTITALTGTTVTGTTIKDYTTISGSSASTGSFARVENVNKLILSTQTVAAAGDAQGNAGAIDANGGSTVFVTGADSAKGVVLPVVANLTIGQTFTIHNTVSGQTLKVYPGSGDKILPAADNTAITIAANTCVVVTHFSADGFVGYEPAVIVSD